MFYDGNGNIINIGTGESGSALKGKTWLCIGDSISNVVGYRQMIKGLNAMNSIDGGFGDGRQIGYSYQPDTLCILNKVADFAAGTPDIITILLGVNDSRYGCPIGTIDDDPDAQSAESYTFYGCYKKLLKMLWDKYGNVPMVIVTPYHRTGGETANSAGHTMSDYVAAIRAVAERYSVPVCDFFAESGLPIGTLTDTDTNKDTGNCIYSEGLHVNTIGASISAPKLQAAMELAIRRWSVPAEGIYSGSTQNYTVAAGAEKAIYIIPTPDYTTDLVVWKSSDETKATVIRTPWRTTNATVKGIAAGDCTITATINGHTRTFNVTVT